MVIVHLIDVIVVSVRSTRCNIELGNGNTLSIEGAKGGKQIQAISVRMISFSFSLGVS